MRTACAIWSPKSITPSSALRSRNTRTARAISIRSRAAAKRLRRLRLAERAELALDVLDHGLGFDEVVLELLVQIQDVADDRGLPPRVQRLERHPVEHPGRDLRALRLAEHPLAGFEPDQHPVAFEHLGGERVVVRDLGFLALVQLEGAERLAHLEDQVLGGLVREREAEHVARHHALVIGRPGPRRDHREVDHARGHHRRLPRSGAGHDHAGFERPRDRGPLFGRGVAAEEVDDRLRVALGHEPATTSAGAVAGASTGNTAPPCG